MNHLRNLVPEAVQPVVRSAYRQVATRTPQCRLLPTFLIIGGQRCGTTTIFKLLEDHPQVLRPPVEKGTDYFTLHYDKSFDWYRGHFATSVSRALRPSKSSQAVSFEACTYYMFHPFAMERIANDMPHVKLVAMLRDPVERAYSAYKHEFARGFDLEPDFTRALKLEDERLDGEIDKIATDRGYESIAHRHHAYRRRGEFAEQLSRVYKHFPTEQVHVLDSGRFFEDPTSQYRDLLDFLGLDPHMPAVFPRYNARPGAPMPDEARDLLAAHYEAHDDRLRTLLGREPSWR